MSAQSNRRDFIKKFSAGILGSGIALNAYAFSGNKTNVFIPERKRIKYNPNPNVALVKGKDRKTNMYNALKLIYQSQIECLSPRIQLTSSELFNMVDGQAPAFSYSTYKLVIQVIAYTLHYLLLLSG